MNYPYSGVNRMYIFVHARNILKIKRAAVFMCEQHAHNLRTRKGSNADTLAEIVKRACSHA